MVLGKSGIIAALAFGFLAGAPSAARLSVEPSAAPPAGALVLFDGRSLDQWEAQGDGGKAGWIVAGGIATVHKPSGNIVTRRKFRNFHLHLEWRVPRHTSGRGQARGNSGVFLAALGAQDAGYEVQILDSWRNRTYSDGQAGAIYKQFAPLAQPIRSPGHWNAYDIDWTAPIFAANGSLISPARVTVVFNGITIHKDVALKGETSWDRIPSYRPHGEAPIMLQAHDDPSPPIAFRNIWLVERP